MKNYTKLITSLAALVAVIGVWGVLLAACASESSTASSTPTQTTVTPSPNVLPSEASAETEEPAVTEYRDPTDVSELPFEVQVYVGSARSLVQSGAVPRQRVTVSAVQADVAREYGITLTAAEADYAVSEILK